MSSKMHWSCSNKEVHYRLNGHHSNYSSNIGTTGRKTRTAAQYILSLRISVSDTPENVCVRPRTQCLQDDGRLVETPIGAVCLSTIRQSHCLNITAFRTLSLSIFLKSSI